MKKTYTCQCCGKSYNLKLIPEVYLPGNCFDCSFWLKKTQYPDYVASRRAIINGEHYMAYAETDGIIRGSGGRRVVIRFFDGRVIKTNNLWCQGEIPRRFRKRLPDNAVFLTKEKMPVAIVNKSEIPF